MIKLLKPAIYFSHSSTLDYGKLADLLRIFTQLKIILQTGEKPLANAIFPLMTGGLILSSSLNFAAIRFYGELNYSYYMVFPAMAVVVMIIILALLPLAIGIFEDSD